MFPSTLVGCLFLLVACNSPDSKQIPAPSRDQPVQAPPKPASVSVPRRMRDHFGKITEARDAVMRGDVQGAAGAVSWFLQHGDLPDAPASFRPHLKTLQATAAQAAGAPQTPASLGQHIARLATICGGCHAVHDHPVKFKPANFGDRSASPQAYVPERMYRHIWAAERMWEGLIADDSERFAAGAATLAKKLEDQGKPLWLAGNLEELRALGERALAATDDSERAAAYGAFISSCHACHES